jgi:hypothetical protein
MLWLIKRYSPATLPSAETYTLLRAMLPKIVRLEFGRMRSVFKAFVDFHRGVTGKVDLSGLGQAPTRAHSKALEAPSHLRNS